MTRVLDSSCSLQFCIVAFAFEVADTTSNLTSCIQVGYTICWSLYLRLSLTWYEYTCSVLLVPSCGRILKLLCLVLTTCLLAAGNISCFPGGGAITQVWAFSLARRPVCFLNSTVYRSLLSLPQGACTRSGYRGRGGEGLALGPLWVPTGLVGGPCLSFFLEVWLEVGLLLKRWVQSAGTAFLQCPLLFLSARFLISSSSHGGPVRSGCCGVKQVSPVASCTLGKLCTESPLSFPSRRGHGQLVRPPCHVTLGEGQWFCFLDPTFSQCTGNKRTSWFPERGWAPPYTSLHISRGGSDGGPFLNSEVLSF